jgi:hypothetical protein
MQQAVADGGSLYTAAAQRLAARKAEVGKSAPVAAAAH